MKALKWIGIVLDGLLVVEAAASYARGSSRLNKTHNVPDEPGMVTISVPNSRQAQGSVNVPTIVATARFCQLAALSRSKRCCPIPNVRMAEIKWI